MKADRPPRTPDRLVTVFVERPRCPTCGAVKLRIRATRDYGAMLVRYATCKACGFKFRILSD